MMRVFANNARRRPLWSTMFAPLWLLAMLCLLFVAAPSARAAFGVEESNFEAGTCSIPPAPTAVLIRRSTRRRAAAPQVGITTLKLNHHPSGLGQEPDGHLRNIRVDIPAGLASDPEALPHCPIAEFNANKCPPDTEVGTNELTVFAAGANVTLSGNVYNLAQPAGLPLDFGIEIGAEGSVIVHSLLEGHVAWSPDYHEYFEIRNIPSETERSAA